MNNAWIAQALNEALPPGAIVVNETITHRLELLRRLTGLRAAGFYEASFGGLGVGLATALGVKHARQDRPVVCTIGDGAFHYNPVAASFGASQELGLPLLVVLFDNAGYLSQKTDVVTYYPEGEAVRSGRFAGTGITPRPEYAKLAEAYGGYGEKVERPQEVPGALARGLEQQRQGRLALIHMVLN
jgi:acetolactate synthase-1/2/3 large subunit